MAQAGAALITQAVIFQMMKKLDHATHSTKNAYVGNVPRILNALVLVVIAQGSDQLAAKVSKVRKDVLLVVFVTKLDEQ